MKNTKVVDSDNFRRWFGDSQVVDETGKPLMVYHGSRVPILSQFDLRLEGTGVVMTGASQKLGGIWFTSSESNADYFADPRDPEALASDEVTVYGDDRAFYAAICDEEDGRLGEVGPFETYQQALNMGHAMVRDYNANPDRGRCVFSVYLSLQNPLVLRGVIPREDEFASARAAGHDGIIALDVVDGSHHSHVYVAFRPEQVKSASWNTGAFDPTSPDIYDSQHTPSVSPARAKWQVTGEEEWQVTGEEEFSP